ncbi:MAG: hypothetical protein RR893_10580 [Clostridia bacterium]
MQMEQYSTWLVTGAVGLMIGALGWFIRRTISEVESKIVKSEEATRGRFEAIEKRVDKQDERFDQMVKDLPKTYAYRDDLIRMTQAIESRLDRIQDLLLEKRKGD